VEASPEGARVAVTGLYQEALGRAPDPGGMAYWSGQLEQGVSRTTVLAGMLGSPEFFSRMQADVAQMNTTDPNVAAHQFIIDAHLFVNQQPAVPPPGIGAPGGDSGSPVDNSGNGQVFDNSGFNPVIDIPAPVVDLGTPVDNSGTSPVFDTSSDNTVIDNSGVDNCGCDIPVIDNSGDNPPVDNSGSNDSANAQAQADAAAQAQVQAAADAQAQADAAAQAQAAADAQAQADAAQAAAAAQAQADAAAQAQAAADAQALADAAAQAAADVQAG
jgi:hypothetical protein